MHALSDEHRIDRLEKKMDKLETKMENGFTMIRSETRADFRTLLGILMAMFATMIFGFVGLFLQHL
jgi:hypothetical protein